jgi:peptidoglycan hydrolase CwlO-like protein
MTDNVIMVILGFIGALLVAIKPILDLNTNITELKVSIDQFRDSVNKLDSRTTEHGKEIDKIKETVVDHEARIKNLEK